MNLPDLDHPLAGPFWAAVSRKELQVPWCAVCDRAVWYPRPHCPHCQGDLHWRRLSGEASLISWCEVTGGLNPHFREAYTCALVSPLESPDIRIVMRVTQNPASSLRCDMPGRVDFIPVQQIGGTPYMAPAFTPYSGS